nr:extracellular nuclease 7 [Bursaphelenchus xylophilus]
MLPKAVIFQIFLSIVGAQGIGNGYPLRIMTFNIWITGENVVDGLYKIAKHIRIVDPDIVTIQELQSKELFGQLLTELGLDYTGVYHNSSGYPDTAIITKHTINDALTFQTSATIGTEIELKSGIVVRFVGAHLAYKSYGPYAAYNKLVTDIKQIMAGETKPDSWNRAKNIKDLIASKSFKKFAAESDSQPFFVCGDFNSPSHLDWTEETRSSHGGWVVEWPATKLLADQGFEDSYRVKNPNVTSHPGYTWSTVNKSPEEWDFTIPEPQDRIDFINFKGKRIQVTDSFTYCGMEPVLPIPRHRNNDYPSDHFAVVSDFVIL